MGTAQLPVPEQPAPLQPVKVELTSGAAWRITLVPDWNLAAQVRPQLMPAGLLVTVPPPVPPSGCTVSVKAGAKVAVTCFCAMPMLNVHGAVPVQLTNVLPEPVELQPVNTEFASGVAMSVTVEFSANAWSHVVPEGTGAVQFMIAGSLVTVPPPIPALFPAVDSLTFFASSKCATTFRDMSIVTVQSPSPGQEKPGSELVQPANASPEPGVWESVTVGEEKGADWLLHVFAQLIPAGLLVTVPLPVVDVAFVTPTDARVVLKFALTLFAASIVTTQVPVPEQPAPLQPVNCTFGFTVALKVTTVFCGICAEHVAPQAIPVTSLVTVLSLAAAVPVFVTVSGNVTPAKFAVTVRAMFMVTVQVPVPGQLNPASELLQPRNVLPADGVAVSVTLAPLLKSNEAVEHATPQLMPGGLLVTVPVAPAVEVFCSDSVWVVDGGPPNRA